jgi:hypothetical protein
MTDKIKQAFAKKNYKWDENFNIVGIRNCAPNVYNKITNIFDDLLTLSYKDAAGIWQYKEWKATTEAGKKGAEKHRNPKGLAILIPGQYNNTYTIDKHQGKYEALCQRMRTVSVWRDNNKDLKIDRQTTDIGMFGINIHKAGLDSTWVENWSEGCQVFKRVKDFDEFMALCKAYRKEHGNLFSYTLLESTDII